MRAIGCLIGCMLLMAGQALAGPPLQRVFYQFDASNGLADNSSQTIKCTKTGRMVITTIGHINFYDGDGFTHIDPLTEHFFPLPKYQGHYHLYFDRFHHLWLKDKYTVTCLDLMTERFISNVDSVMKNLGVSQQVDDLFGDVKSKLWLLSGRQLIGVDDHQTVPVALDEELQDIDVYDDRLQLQFFANSVVSVYDLKQKRRLYDLAALSPDEAEKYSRSSVVCPDSNLFYQIRNGDKDAVLLRFDISTRQWTKLLETPYHLNNMVINRNKLYIASEYGYWTYNMRTGETEHVEELLLTRDRHLNTDINTICFDRQGGMWIGTEKRGVLYSRPFKIPFVSYRWDQPEAGEYARMMDQLPPPEPLPRHVNCKYVDSRGWTWTGTYTGLQLLLPGQEKPRVFTARDGLLNEMVHSVVEDRRHNIWVATSYGVSHLYIKADSVHQIETYTARDNVPAESFVNGRAMLLEDGTIVMQSLDHMMAFHPTNFYEQEVGAMELYPKLIKLIVNGHYVTAGTMMDGRVILDRAITRANEVSVNYNQNSLTLTFSGLNYMRPSQTYYRIRVKGVYDEWQVLSYANANGRVDRQGLLHLPLPSLRPGVYTIELQASMNPDTWLVEPFKWTVRVEEPWWRSTGIYLLLALLLATLIAVNIYFYMRNTRQRYLLINHEDDLLRRIKSFAARCDSITGEVLTPKVTLLNEKAEANSQDYRLFEDAMLKVVPWLHAHPNERVSMRQLSLLTGIETTLLYEVLSTNLYKSPHQLAIRMRLQDAADMLQYTTMTIEEIASHCGFVTPNFFIASFYHQYRQTPVAYREANSK